MSLNLTATQIEILSKVLESRDEQFVPPPTNYQISVWLLLLMQALGKATNSLINESDSETFHDDLISLCACCLGALEDYYEGTQDLSLNDVYCSIDYLKEQGEVIKEQG
ncbi:MAG: hypothetical protein ACKPFF_18360 [Planktothrix sp.]